LIGSAKVVVESANVPQPPEEGEGQLISLNVGTKTPEEVLVNLTVPGVPKPVKPKDKKSQAVVLKS